MVCPAANVLEVDEAAAEMRIFGVEFGIDEPGVTLEGIPMVGNVPSRHRPIGVAFDGANIWVANAGSGTVSKR